MDDLLKEAISESGLDEFLKEYSPPELTAYPSSSTANQAPFEEQQNNVVKANPPRPMRIVSRGANMNMARPSSQVLMTSQNSRLSESPCVLYYPNEQQAPQQRIIPHQVYAKSNPSGPMRIINRQNGGINLNRGTPRVIMPLPNSQAMDKRMLYYSNNEQKVPKQRVIRQEVYAKPNLAPSMRVVNRQSGINLNMGRATPQILMPSPSTRNIGTPRIIYYSEDQHVLPPSRIYRQSPQTSINQKVQIKLFLMIFFSFPILRISTDLQMI